MSSKYKASIIIPTYNRRHLLTLTLKSLCQQTLPKEDFEVIIVDDGSTDDTKEVVADFSNSLNTKYIYQEKDGFRVAAARNKGILSSEGNICIFIDCGILLGTTGVEKNVICHRSDNEKAVLGYIYGFDEYNENEKYLLDLNIDPFNVDQYFERLQNDRILDYRDDVYQEIGDDLTTWSAPWSIFFTGYVSVKRDTLIRVGMFDESYTTWGCEDTDLGLSLYTNGVQIVLERDLKCIHYPHEKSRFSVGEDAIKKKKEYLHKKYNLKSTELALTTPSRQLNQLMFKSV